MIFAPFAAAAPHIPQQRSSELPSSLSKSFTNVQAPQSHVAGATAPCFCLV